MRLHHKANGVGEPSFLRGSEFFDVDEKDSLCVEADLGGYDRSYYAAAMPIKR